MADFAFLVLSIAFFALTLGMVHLYEKLREAK